MNGPNASVRKRVEDALGIRGAEWTWSYVATGNSRKTWKLASHIEGGETFPKYVVRYDPGTGPLSNTLFTLRREAEIYRALADEDVPVPRVLDLSDSGDIMVLEAMQGADTWSGQVLGPYLEVLAKLHSVEVSKLSLDSVSATPNELDAWETVYRRRVSIRSPFVEAALVQLKKLYPVRRDGYVLCHGDAGPGNFLHEGGQITALLDWEFSHVGDPVDDIAWITVRAWLFDVPLGDFRHALHEHYIPNSPLPYLDPASLKYWQAVVLLRNLIIVLAAIEHGLPGRDRFVHMLLKPGLQWALLDTVADLAGLQMPSFCPSLGSDRSSGRDYVRELALGLNGISSALKGDPAEYRRARLMGRLASQLAESWPSEKAVRIDAHSQNFEAVFPRLVELGASELNFFPQWRQKMARPILPQI